jgi:hypothetical protein
MEGMPYAFFREHFIIGMKDEISAHVLMAHPQTWLESTQRSKESPQIIFSQTQKPYFLPRFKPSNPTPLTNTLKINNLIGEEMAQRQLKGLF